MARTVDGVSSILRGARMICRMGGRFGTVILGNRTTPELKAAVDALIVACQAFDALDDYPGQQDSSGPIRAGEDVSPGA